MAFAQGLTAIIVFWAIIGGLGASLAGPAQARGQADAARS
jgi:hypothetical protein